VSARGLLQALAEGNWTLGPHGLGNTNDVCRRWLERARSHPGEDFAHRWLRPGYVVGRCTDDVRAVLRTLRSDEIRDVFWPGGLRLIETPRGPRVFKIPGTNIRRTEGT
jgi:hypothetical protein